MKFIVFSHKDKKKSQNERNVRKELLNIQMSSVVSKACPHAHKQAHTHCPSQNALFIVAIEEDGDARAA